MIGAEAPLECWPPPRSILRLLWDEQAVSVRVMRLLDDTALLCAGGVGEDEQELLLPDAETPVEVRWPDASGLLSRPARLVDPSSVLVTLQAGGPTTRLQRRRFFRASVALEVEVLHGPHITRGRTNDLSEGGARVSLQEDVQIAQTKVTTRVRLDRRQLDIPSTVVRHHEGGEIGMEFGEITAPDADALRRHVISAQLDARRKEHR